MERGNDSFVSVSGVVQMDRSVVQLMQGLASLDISQTSASHTPTLSTPVGGARPKVRPRPEEVSGEVNAELPDQSQSAESAQLESQVGKKCEILRLCLKQYMNRMTSR